MGNCSPIHLDNTSIMTFVLNKSNVTHSVYCGFIDIRGAFIVMVVGLNHEIKCQLSSNSRSNFITEIKKQRN